MKNEKVLIIIPARSGSKGFRNKNIRYLGGHPLIAHSITAAHFCRYADRIIVSTDSHEIAGIAKEYGADVPFLRPPELAKDDSRDIEFVNHTLDNVDGDYGYIVILRPTSPIRPHGFVNTAVMRLVENPFADSLRAVTQAPATPYKMWTVKGITLVPLITDPAIPEPYNAPRQALPSVYWQTGHIDVIRHRTIERGSISGGYIMPYFIDRKYCVDIDTETDFEKANEIYKQFRSEEIVMPCHPSATTHPRHTLP